MAEQKEPIRCRVGFKLIKLGMDTRQVIARFEAERQALAFMGPPDIIKVFDVGATETGRPYFVMELMQGIKITHYCDQNHLSTERPAQRQLSSSFTFPVIGEAIQVSRRQKQQELSRRKRL